MHSYVQQQPTQSNPPWMSAGRLLLCLIQALVVTIALVYVMTTLIASDAEPPPVVESFPIPNFIIKDPPPIDNRYKQPELAKTLVAPTTPTKMTIELPEGEGCCSEISYTPDGGTGPNLAFNNNPTPLVRINPQYPRTQAQRGVEGYVMVRFDITEYGSTTNIEITEANPPRVFDRAVMKAVAQWKYRPKEVEGAAVMAHGIVERIAFVMEKEG